MRISGSGGHVLGGSLLVAGTTIGVGMLALPVVTGPAGLLPSVLIYCLCWLFMVCTGLLLVEVCLWMPKDTSFISMGGKILGTTGKILFGFMYLFLFLSVMIAHIAGGSDITADLFNNSLPNYVFAILYTVILAPVIYLGTRSVDRLNMLLISGVAICYLGFIGVSFGAVQIELLKSVHWEKSWIALPILFTAFAYQVIIPSLVTYMQRDAKKVRHSILIGSTIPLIVYLIWEILILGIIPIEGANGLLEANALGQNAVGPLRHFVQNGAIFAIGKYFAFFALTTSFIPLALSFFDFLADGLRIKKKGLNRLLLCIAVFGIPLLITLQYPHVFLIALSYAGGISCAFLFGLMPPLMAWIGRYVEHLPHGQRQLGGGKPMLICLMVFAFLILGGQIVQNFL